MKIETKDAAVTPAGPQDEFPGSFQVILSAPTRDRDGETLLPEDWKLPLPGHITFDVDHGMSVVTTVGSGVPSLDPVSGNLIVDGTYSSLPRAQEVRTLVAEGHIRTTSVAFMTEPAETKDGKSRKVRELLNGAFCAIPSNREAVVLASKVFAAKAGARNSKTDAAMIQQIHDHTATLGAACPPPAKSLRRKSLAGSIEAVRDRVMDALADAYPAGYPWSRGIVPDGNGGGYVVFEVEPKDGGGSSELLRQTYTDDGAVVTLTGAATPVDLTEIVIPDPDDPADQSVGAPAKSAPGTPGADRAGAPADPAEMQSRKAQFRALNHYIDAV